MASATEEKNKTHLVNVWKRKISSTAAAVAAIAAVAAVEIKFIGK